MASRNQIALQEGRITERDYNRMAVYKWIQYKNNEDLDYDADYNDYGLQKLIPTVKYYPAAQDYPGVVTEIYTVFRNELEPDELREICEEWDGGAVYVGYRGRWYWVPWGMAGGDFLYLEEVINTELTYPGRLEVIDACDEL